MVEKTIKDVLKEASDMLKGSVSDTPLLDAQLILAKSLSVDRIFVITNMNKAVNGDLTQNFFEDIRKRAMGMPVQYIVGTQEFMGLKFNVSPDVLIPRPDTEILVEEVLKDINISKTYDILDIGTGSGCISISLAKFIPNSRIYTIDISSGAINIAKLNAKLNSVSDKIRFYHGSLFSAITNEDIKFDIIVSNPPYIPSEDIDELMPNVKDFEPRLALDGGEDGLDFYRQIISDSRKYFKDDSSLYFETGYDQAGAVSRLMQENNFYNIKTVCDLSGIERVVKGKIKL